MRLRSLGISIDDKDSSLVAPAPDPASAIIPGVANIEEQLTVLEIRYLEAIGAAVVPQPKDQTE